ncbi:putative helicase family protein [Vibrio cholerae]|uniref:helicase-related protein n=1 Tax=Vibrio cholerae TaxID=666 RepID=UPI0011D6CA0D|nr:helicase-related protein [Vibrio cholerae]TXZ23633.1 hypothetical protein FXE70_06540 [Vibrio cholerae]GIA19002.1 putative helicase family protein [Vibrio cholerae]
MNEFTEARLELINYLKTQLIGPVGGTEEKLKDAPHKRYLMGTLFPAAACVDDSNDDKDDDSSTEALANDFKPSSMAMSFAMQANTSLLLTVSAGRYHKGNKPEWQRYELLHEEKLEQLITGKKELFDKRARLDIKVRTLPTGKVVTIALSNNASSGERLDPEKCLYQCSIRVNVLAGNIREYPSSDRFKLDDEQQELNLTYRKRVPWAVGHGVAVDWSFEEGPYPVSLFTEAMPTHEVKDFSTDIDQKKYPGLDRDILSITRIADTDSATDAQLLSGYRQLIDVYRTWINELEDEQLDRRYLAAKERIIQRLKNAAQRMENGVSLLQGSPVAMEAFRMANKAMLMQMIHSGKAYAGESKSREFTFEQPDYFSSEVVENFRWRPFQLAFQLLVLESLIPDENGKYAKSHDEVDLLWFPTGGGKTEAYLAVAAWEMIFRRLTNGEKGAGTAVIKRYTLRLLTSQQFQRAGSLICALDKIRRSDERLGKSHFSLGLWAGEGSTPNNFKDAHGKFVLARDDHEPENHFQLQHCPWCGTEIMPKAYTSDDNAYGIRTSPESRFEFFCPNETCDFHDHLPIQVVDDALYRSPPSLLIGTIDKFARLTWKAEAAAFFGDRKVLPPSLIIQDELHLISGPLGTIAGIYEAGFDTIMEVLGQKPKIIAATATIRAANQQSVRLFGRKVNVFPPSGTDQADSFFSKEELEKTGRMYVGVMPSGHTGQTSLVQTSAAALLAPFELGFSDALLDSYWTLPIYHNSRRELGKTMTLGRDDIPERIKVISQNKHDTREINIVEELSAGVRGSKIPEVLENLSKTVPDAVDILPCTNMISVGVDIERLGMMVIAGQPKATAEYIQASSRVGRSKKRPPGIVITQYSPTKPRDRSHYETFKSYHQALYRYVEPTSITPWAKPALERALHASLIAAVRVTGYLRKNESARYLDTNHPDFVHIATALKKRIVQAMDGMPQSEQKTTLQQLDSIIDTWQERCNRTSKPLTHYEANKQFQPLIQSFESASHAEAWRTLNSMRNVDTETHLYIRGEN